MRKERGKGAKEVRDGAWRWGVALAARIYVAVGDLRDEKMECDMGTRVVAWGSDLSLEIRTGKRWVGTVNDVSHVQESVRER